MKELFGMEDDALIHAARHYKWDQEKMEGQWFDNQAKLVKELGIEFEKKLNNDPAINYSTASKNGGVCVICYEPLSAQTKFSMECGHEFCLDCWREFLIEKVRSGPQGLQAGCMQVGCNMKIGHTVWDKILKTSPADKETYWKWLCKSYTDDNSSIKWCPELGCEFCFEREQFASDMEVHCECGMSFCFACN